jgi:hypothetical protein
MTSRNWTHHIGTRGSLSDTPLGIVTKGALAGLAGTMALTAILKAAQWIAKRSNDGQQPQERDLTTGIGAAQALTGGQVQVPFLDQSTEIFAQKVATGLFGTSLSSGTRTAASVSVHVVYGAFWGGVYGLIQSSLRLPPVAHGPLYGLIVWLIGPVTLVPAMGIMPPLPQQGTPRVLMVAGIHVVYGLVLSLAFDAFTRQRRRR